MREDEVEYADGTQSLYGLVEKGDSALVVPADGDRFHLVEQYRYTTRSRSWEFPGGAFPPGVSGTVEELAAAELAEETGLRAGRWERLGLVHSANGMSGESVHVFLATDLTVGSPSREPTEQDMRQGWFPRAELERMLGDGTITDGSTLAAWALLGLRRGA